MGKGRAKGMERGRECRGKEEMQRKRERKYKGKNEMQRKREGNAKETKAKGKHQQ